MLIIQIKSKTMDSYYEGCRNLAQIFLKKKKIKKFIQIGSVLSMGSIRSPQIEDKVSKKLLSTYGQAKLYSTNFLLDLHKKV